MYEFLKNLDRRWVFLLMGLAVLVPILTGVRFPEDPSPMTKDVFKTINDLPEGSNVLLAYDYDPGSEGELAPMAAEFTRHCAERKLKMYYVALWPLGVPMISKSIQILEDEYPDLQYGVDYVNLGYKSGLEGVIKVIVTDLRKEYTTDVEGTELDKIPMTKNIKNIQSMDMIISVSAGDPGTKQWVQFASTPFGIPIVAGVTGVQAPQLYPYIPNQLIGVLGAIKGAAEYEQVMIENFPKMKDNPLAQEGLRRMGPQLVAHTLIIVLIILANVIYFIEKKRGDVR